MYSRIFSRAFPQIFPVDDARSGNTYRLRPVTKNACCPGVLFAYIAIRFDAFVVSSRPGVPAR
ncbi:hypothetical protein DID96_01350 [Burkholderia sp. Bp8963]|nr:hypothetical protein DID96_01350 [Burkholderia sp. Bp8963]